MIEDLRYDPSVDKEKEKKEEINEFFYPQHAVVGGSPLLNR